jgi:hypothetical protein
VSRHDRLRPNTEHRAAATMILFIGFEAALGMQNQPLIN